MFSKKQIYIRRCIIHNKSEMKWFAILPQPSKFSWGAVHGFRLKVAKWKIATTILIPLEEENRLHKWFSEEETRIKVLRDGKCEYRKISSWNLEFEKLVRSAKYAKADVKKASA